MKQLKRLSMVFALFVATSLTVACEEEESSSVGGDCYDELVELSDILVSRTNTFSANPTTGNCNSLRSAALDLYDAAQDCDDYGYLYEEGAQYWIDLDCSVFD